MVYEDGMHQVCARWDRYMEDEDDPHVYVWSWNGILASGALL